MTGDEWKVESSASAVRNPINLVAGFRKSAANFLEMAALSRDAATLAVIRESASDRKRRSGF